MKLVIEIPACEPLIYIQIMYINTIIIIENCGLMNMFVSFEWANFSMFS